MRKFDWFVAVALVAMFFIQYVSLNALSAELESVRNELEAKILLARGEALDLHDASVTTMKSIADRVAR